MNEKENEYKSKWTNEWTLSSGYLLVEDQKNILVKVLCNHYYSNTLYNGKLPISFDHVNENQSVIE